jgi:hypothetical protein
MGKGRNMIFYQKLHKGNIDLSVQEEGKKMGGINWLVLIIQKWLEGDKLDDGLPLLIVLTKWSLYNTVPALEDMRQTEE